jgi:hypothetical protein
VIDARFRPLSAAAIAHPDANGGDRSKWERLELAKAVLDAHHGLAKNAGGNK